MAYLGRPAPRAPGDAPWWKASPDKRATAVCAMVDWLQNTPEEKQRQAQALHHARLYGNRHFDGLSLTAHARTPKSKSNERLTANVAKAVVDTATAKIAKNRPKATLVTNDGGWEQQHRARRLDRFVEGAFQDVDLYTLGPKAFRSAGIFGTAALKWYAAHGRICVDRVLPTSLLVDPADGANMRPRCMYQVHYVDRHVLLELYAPSGRGKVAEAVRNAPTSDADVHGVVRSLAEPIRVVEAWHLPSGPEARDGRHVIAIDGVVLRDVEWTRDRFPFVFYRWCDAEVGFWGTGLVEEVDLLQRGINRTLKRIEECIRLMAVPRILMDTTAKVVRGMITNEVGAIIKWTSGAAGGTPPQFLTPPAVPGELFAHLQWQISQAFEMTGISQLSATSQKPRGLDSGRALMVYNDIETERFAIKGREYESFFLECSDQVIDLAEEIDREAARGFSVVNRGRSYAQRFEWRDVRMDRDSFTLQVQPTSALPRDVAGRTAIVQQWVAAGYVDSRTAQRLLDFPDLDRHESLEFAAMEIVDRTIDRFLDPDRDVDDAYLPPEPFDDLAYGLVRMVQAYHRARLDDVPEERLELFRQWLDEAQALLSMAAPAQPAAESAGAPGNVTALPTAAPALSPANGMAA